MSRAPSRTDRRIALGLFFGAFFLLWATEAAVGFVRDETVYFAAAEQAARWLRYVFQAPSRAFTDALTTQAFDFNHEHPAGMKFLFGISFQLFHEVLGVLRPATAFRLPAFAVAASIPAVLHAWGSVLYGRRAGLFAALCFLAVPRHFFHAHLACFDMPVAAGWLWVVYAFWRSETDGRWWLWTAVLWGAALATKHNALFLPPVLLPFVLVRGFLASAGKPAARALLQQALLLLAAALGLLAVLLLLETPEGFLQRWTLLSPATCVVGLWAAGFLVLGARLYRTDVPTFRAVAAFGAMLLLGPAILYVVWPWLWYHPVDRFRAYLEFHATHVHYAWTYLGTVLREPPFPLTYVLVVTALTLPVSVLAPMGAGLFSLGVRATGSLFSAVAGALSDGLGLGGAGGRQRAGFHRPYLVPRRAPLRWGEALAPLHALSGASGGPRSPAGRRGTGHCAWAPPPPAVAVPCCPASVGGSVGARRDADCPPPPLWDKRLR